MRLRPSALPARRPAAAVIEFAAVLPVLLLFVLGIIEFGRMLMVAQVTTSASREGARYAVQAEATPGAVESYVRTYLSSASIPADAVSAVAVEQQVSSTDPQYTAQNQGWVACNNLATVPQGTAIRVRVAINFSAVSWLPSDVFVPSGTLLNGATVMRKE
jgi:Flp pilus assembly protein TadG